MHAPRIFIWTYTLISEAIDELLIISKCEGFEARYLDIAAEEAWEVI